MSLMFEVLSFLIVYRGSGSCCDCCHPGPFSPGMLPHATSYAEEHTSGKYTLSEVHKRSELMHINKLNLKHYLQRPRHTYIHARPHGHRPQK